ncbi:hypothetical protein HN011_002821, partial [Eciton burchellii]
VDDVRPRFYELHEVTAGYPETSISWSSFPYGNPTVRRNNPSRLRRRQHVTRANTQKATLNSNSDDVAPQDDPLVELEVPRRGDLAGEIAKRSPTRPDRRQS